MMNKSTRENLIPRLQFGIESLERMAVNMYNSEFDEYELYAFNMAVSELNAERIQSQELAAGEEDPLAIPEELIRRVSRLCKIRHCGYYGGSLGDDYEKHPWLKNSPWCTDAGRFDAAKRGFRRSVEKHLVNTENDKKEDK